MEHFIPIELFQDRHTAILILFLALSIAAVVKGADWLVEGAVGLSQRLGVPKVIIGATVVSLGTTMPEAAVSVMAAFQGLPDYALGNSVGSIICDTGLIFGICCLMTRLPKDDFVLNRHGWIQFGSGVLLVAVSLLFFNGEGQRIIPRYIGFALVALLAGYLCISMVWARKHRDFHVVLRGKTDEEIELKEAGKPVLIEFGWLALGLAIVILASHIMIQSVRVLCERWGVPPAIIGATVVAFGTSLPELITGIASVIKGHKSLLVGNIIGADILNVLFVTGAAACAAPLVVPDLFLKLHFPAMMGILILFRLNIHFTKKEFARWPGFLFLGAYLIYLVCNFLFGKPLPH